MVVTRFAPSPTGHLHLGHVYAAKVAYDLSKSVPDGRFLLRYEDIDISRVRPHYYDEIEDDLNWLGLMWDSLPLRQARRMPFYHLALNQLSEQSLTYPCFCTRKEIINEVKRMYSAPHSSSEVLYPRTCLHLSPAEACENIQSGKPYAWRLNSQKIANLFPELYFNDQRFGTIKADPFLNGDVVLARKEIGIAYHLAVVVDDAFQGITHITRGEDLLNATHTHRYLQSALNYISPIYYHHRMVCNSQGVRLAKRDSAQSVKSLRKLGHSYQEILELANPF